MTFNTQLYMINSRTQIRKLYLPMPINNKLGKLS